MLDSASETRGSTVVSCMCLGRNTCPTWSQVGPASDAAKVCLNRAFVSDVSLVPPYLRLLKDYRKEDWERQGKAAIGALPRGLGQVGQVGQVQR